MHKYNIWHSSLGKNFHLLSVHHFLFLSILPILQVIENGDSDSKEGVRDITEPRSTHGISDSTFHDIVETTVLGNSPQASGPTVQEVTESTLPDNSSKTGYSAKETTGPCNSPKASGSTLHRLTETTGPGNSPEASGLTVQKVTTQAGLGNSSEVSDSVRDCRTW